MAALALDIVIATDNSPLTENHHDQDTLSFMNNEKLPDFIVILLLETVVTVLFLDITLEIESVSGIIAFRIDFLQYNLQDLYLHLECLSKLYLRIPLKIMILTSKAF